VCIKIGSGCDKGGFSVEGFERQKSTGPAQTRGVEKRVNLFESALLNSANAGEYPVHRK